MEREVCMGINYVGTVCIFVSDQDRAKAFYTETLGLELRTDQPLYPGAASRWVAVAPAGAKTEIILYLPDENWEHYRQVVGKSQAITLDISGIQDLHARLKSKGVKILQEPDPQPWGTYLTIQDSEGNSILFVEQPKRS
jgi:lactoylglutathione lyase